MVNSCHLLPQEPKENMKRKKKNLQKLNILKPSERESVTSL